MDEQTIILSPCSLSRARAYTREQYETLKQTGLLWELHPDAPTSWPFPEETKRSETEILHADIEQLKRIVLDLEGEIKEQEEERDKFVDYSAWLQRLVEHLCRGIPITEDITFHAPYHAQMAKNKQADIGKLQAESDERRARAERAEQELAKATSELTTLFSGDKLPEDASNNALGVQEYIAGLRRALDATRKAEVAYQERSTRLQKTLDMLLAVAHDPRYAGMKNDESQTDSKYLNAYIKMVEEEYPYTPYWDGIYWCFPYEIRGEGGFGGGVGVAKFSSFRVAMDSAMKISFNS